MFERVKQVIIEQLGDVKITPDTDLLTDLDINSLDLVELVCAFEVAFDLEVPEKSIRKFVRVKDIIRYLEDAGA